MPRPRDENLLAAQLGQELYRLREAKGLTQVEAARMAGTSQSRIASIEAGRHAYTGRPTLPSPDLVARLAATYGVKRERLMLMAGYLPWVIDGTEADELIACLSK